MVGLPNRHSFRRLGNFKLIDMYDREQAISNFQAAARATGITFDVRTADMIIRVWEKSNEVGDGYTIGMARQITDEINEQYPLENAAPPVPAE